MRKLYNHPLTELKAVRMMPCCKCNHIKPYPASFKASGPDGFVCESCYVPVMRKAVA